MADKPNITAIKRLAAAGHVAALQDVEGRAAVRVDSRRPSADAQLTRG